MKSWVSNNNCTIQIFYWVLYKKCYDISGNSAEDTFNQIDQETLDLLQAGKLDVFSLCEEKVRDH